MGKLIVLEGTDGSGKSTQLRMLAERLQRDGIGFRRLQFPQYQEPSSALIRMYLGGEFGENPGDVNAYAASTFYAVDRYASYVKDWRPFYLQGGLVLSDRYTTSNAVHQAGKVPEAERSAFLRWLYDLEYVKMGLPQPDLVLWLNMPVEHTLRLLREREGRNRTSADIHEKNEGYLECCHRMAAAAAEFYHWTAIDCVSDGCVRPAEDIAAEIYAHIQRCLEE